MVKQVWRNRADQGLQPEQNFWAMQKNPIKNVLQLMFARVFLRIEWRVFYKQVSKERFLSEIGFLGALVKFLNRGRGRLLAVS
jgi:hypothetical protein